MRHGVALSHCCSVPHWRDIYIFRQFFPYFLLCRHFSFFRMRMRAVWSDDGFDSDFLWFSFCFYQKCVDICQQTDINLNLIPLWYKTSHCEHLLQRISSNPESRSYEGQAERCIMIRMKLLSAAAMVFWRKTMGHLTSCTGMHILTHCCMYEISPNPLYFEHSQMAPIVTWL